MHSEIIKMQQALALLGAYDNTRGDGWPIISVEYNGISRKAVISIWYERGRMLKEFSGSEYPDGLERLEELIDEQHNHLAD